MPTATGKIGIEEFRLPEFNINYYKPTRHHIPENGILHSHRPENLKFYKIGIVRCLIRT
jgi:hypothetical protein